MKLKSILTSCTPLLLGTLISLYPASASLAQPVKELDRIIAVVNDNVITKSELQRRIRVLKQQLREEKVKLPPESVFRKQVLERLVMENIMVQLASRRGIRISEEGVNRYISSIAQSKKLTLSQFRKILQKDGISFAEFRQNIKDNMMMDQLKRQFVETEVKITRQEVDSHLANMSRGKQTEYQLAHILIGIPEAASPEQIEKSRVKAQSVLKKLKKGADFGQTAIASSDGQQALKGGRLGWLKAAQLPSLFATTIEKMSPGNISDLIRSPSGFHILKLENKRSKGGKHIVKQTLARHILIKSDAVTSDTQAKQKLTKIRQRILAGEDFAKLAKANSDDKGSAIEGGSLGWNGPGKFVPAFEQAMNKLKQGEISPVFRSPFGWHIVQVMSRRKHDDTEEYQRLQVQKLIHNRKANEAIENWMRRIRDEAYVEYQLDN